MSVEAKAFGLLSYSTEYSVAHLAAKATEVETSATFVINASMTVCQQPHLEGLSIATVSTIKSTTGSRR